MVDLGFVGEPEKIDTSVLDQIIGRDLIPVLAPIASGPNGETFNVNADTFAGYIAGALKAKRLLLLTDVPGVLDKNEEAHSGNVGQRRAQADRRRHHLGGMIPKVETCITALEQGVEGVVILDGKSAARGAARIVHRSRRGTLIHR